MKGAVIQSIDTTEELDVHVTRITINLERRDEIDCPPTPPCAVIGDDWLSLVDNLDGERLIDVGYWELEPEGMAMMFLRLAWIAAHRELRDKARRKP